MWVGLHFRKSPLVAAQSQHDPWKDAARTGIICEGWLDRGSERGGVQAVVGSQTPLARDILRVMGPFANLMKPKDPSPRGKVYRI